MPLTVSEAQAVDAPQWDAFVETHPEGRFCHLWGFRQALEATYGYRCVYLNIHADGRTIGLFPSIVAKGGRPRLVSQPFNEYGGPLLENPLTPDAYTQLGELLLPAARNAGCECIEIRGGPGCEGAEHSELWAKRPLHRYAELTLEDPEKLWHGSLTHEARKGVNQARKAGLRTEIRRGSEAVAEPFYSLYLRSMKRLGVPPHPARLFQNLSRALDGRVVAAWVFSGSQPASVLLGVMSGNRVQIWITASDGNYWSVRPNDLAHWDLIRWATLQKLRVFDFGSARYAGQIQFKKKWGVGFKEYACYLIERNGAREHSVIPSVDSSARWMTTLSRIWRASVPLRLTPLLGAPIRKYLTK